MTVAALTPELDASRDRVFASIRGLTEEQFRHVPAGETWCLATHLAHLLRVERAFLAALAGAGDVPYMPKARAENDDDPALTQHLAVPQIVHGMLAARRDLVAALSRRDEARPAIRHELFGEMTPEQIAAKAADHEREHAADVERLAAAAPSVRGGREAIIPLTQSGRGGGP